MSYYKVQDGVYRIFIEDGKQLNGKRKRNSRIIRTELKGKALERFLLEEEWKFEEELKQRSRSFDKLKQMDIQSYFNWYKEYREFAVHTIYGYECMMNRLSVMLASKPFLNYTKSDLTTLLLQLRELDPPLAPRTIRNHMNFLKGMYSTAVRLEVIDKNPMDNIEYSSPELQLEQNYLTEEEASTMLHALENEHIRYRLVVTLALTTGLRLGELYALTPADIDRNRHVISVSKSLSITVGEKQITETKTKANRIVHYPNSVDPLLEEYLEWRSLLNLSTDTLFCSLDGNLPAKSSLDKWFKNFLKRNNLKPITFHGLRHTSATLLLTHGINIRNISERLGHSRTSTTTDYYAHALSSVDKQAADILSGVLSGTGSV